MVEDDPIEPTVTFEGEPSGAAACHPKAVPPARIGRYRVERLLGNGSFGLVYLARDDQLTRPVAIKVPHPERVSSSDEAKLYLAEAQTVASLDHPHIVPVYDLGSTDEFPVFIVSKYIDGGSLAAVLKHSRKGFVETARLLAMVAEAVHYAHKQGVFHRDLKPSNILIDKADRPFVTDFGLALRERDIGKGSRYVGTPAYMSPEQARGEGHRIDGRSDVFSLGVLMYEMLVGRRPFQGETRFEVLEQISTREAQPPRQIDDAVDRGLERICLKALSKRAADRYLTALDMADDLRAWAAAAAPRLGTKPTEIPGTAPGSFKRPPRPQEGKLDSQRLTVVPKGLRSFDEHDADFFLELLPGPRDRDALPEAIRFWKARIEEPEAEKTFAVGLIYGPSGCGKSSLVKAGLLPRIANHVIPVYLESTHNDTEARLLKALRRRVPGLPHNFDLVESLAALRQGYFLEPGAKALVVLDQFEQWLHAAQDAGYAGLVQALRQCDGARLQCLVLVRDDFWLGISRFMQALEIVPDGGNSRLVDLFDSRHARKVLVAFGEAFGVLPEGSCGKDQHAFLDQAIAGLAQDHRVVPVRLTLFAEVVKDKPWTSATLKSLGGAAGVGVIFLEEAFCSPTSDPRSRQHQQAAEGVLRALLPEPGTDIKGHLRSRRDLLDASGYANRPREFESLLQILDGEIRLITPVDPEYASGDEGVLDATGGEQYYQLTHDYLVGALREWLTRKQRETRRGRAEMCLTERAATWVGKPEKRYLPSLFEFLDILLFAPARTWTTPQKRMMRAAARFHGTRWMLGLVFLAVIAWSGVSLRARLQAGALVERLSSAEIGLVPGILKELERHRHYADPLLRERFASAADGSMPKLHAALALAPTDEASVRYLREQLLRVSPSQFPIVRDSLGESAQQKLADFADSLWSVATAATEPVERRFRASCALAAYRPQDERWRALAPFVARYLAGLSAADMVAWRSALHPAGNWLIEPLVRVFRDSPRGEQVRQFAAETLADYAKDDTDLLFELILEADPKSFDLFLTALQSNSTAAEGRLQEELERTPGASEEAVPEQADVVSDDVELARAQRRSHAAVSLARLGRPQFIWPRLAFTPAPYLRTELIHDLGDYHVDVNALFDRLEVEEDASTRRALLLALGRYTRETVPMERQNALVAKLAAVYAEEPDPGLHGAIEWLMHIWGRDSDLRAVVERAKTNEPGLKLQLGDDGRGWYVNSTGQTFVVFPAGEFMMGLSPDDALEFGRGGYTPSRIEVPFALAATEVTRDQYRAFLRSTGAEDADDSSAGAGDLPQTYVHWYEAAHYCNWLSQQDRIEPDQWCYEPNERGEYGLGMKARTGRNLTGYRLPSEDEWEYACRAGTRTSRYFGPSLARLHEYVWCSSSSQDRLWPVALKIPNDAGLFDMLGNVSEWCSSRRSESETIQEKEDAIVRGGSFSLRPAIAQAGFRVAMRIGGAAHDLGFRPARTFVGKRNGERESAR